MSALPSMTNLQTECITRGKLRAAELEWSLQTPRVINPEPETQFDAAPAWPLWFCAAAVVALVAFAAAVWP